MKSKKKGDKEYEKVFERKDKIKRSLPNTNPAKNAEEDRSKMGDRISIELIFRIIIESNEETKKRW